MSPQRSDDGLTTNVPNGETDVFIFHSLHIETWTGKRKCVALKRCGSLALRSDRKRSEVRTTHQWSGWWWPPQPASVCTAAWFYLQHPGPLQTHKQNSCQNLNWFWSRAAWKTNWRTFKGFCRPVTQWIQWQHFLSTAACRCPVINDTQIPRQTRRNPTASQIFYRAQQ